MNGSDRLFQNIYDLTGFVAVIPVRLKKIIMSELK